MKRLATASAKALSRRKAACSKDREAKEAAAWKSRGRTVRDEA